MARTVLARRPSALLLLATLAFVAVSLAAAHSPKATRSVVTKGPITFAAGTVATDQGRAAGSRLILTMAASIGGHGEFPRTVVCTAVATDANGVTSYACTAEIVYTTGSTASQGTLWRSAGGGVLTGALAVVGGTGKEFQYVLGQESPTSYDMTTGTGSSKFTLK
jgi:hypothetical protein